MPYDYVSTIAVQGDGKVLLGGSMAEGVGATLPSVTRFSPDGALDGTFAHAALPDVGTSLGSLGIQPDGKVLVLGSDKLVRLNADGGPDTSFRQLPVDPRGVGAVAVQRDGRVLLGATTTTDGVERAGVLRLYPDGQLDAGFKVSIDGWYGPIPPLPPIVKTIFVQDDGRILIGGLFTGVNGVPRSNVARLRADGTVDQEFQNGLAGASSWVRSLAVQSDGRILIAGSFDLINGVPMARVARLWGSAEVSPVMKSVHRDGRELSLTGEALPGRRYRVQYKQSLTGMEWVSLGDDVTSSADGLASTVDPQTGEATQRFYRVVLLP